MNIIFPNPVIICIYHFHFLSASSGYFILSLVHKHHRYHHIQLLSLHSKRPSLVKNTFDLLFQQQHFSTILIIIFFLYFVVIFQPIIHSQSAKIVALFPLMNTIARKTWFYLIEMMWEKLLDEKTSTVFLFFLFKSYMH